MEPEISWKTRGTSSSGPGRTPGLCELTRECIPGPSVRDLFCSSLSVTSVGTDIRDPLRSQGRSRNRWKIQVSLPTGDLGTSEKRVQNCGFLGHREVLGATGRQGASACTDLWQKRLEVSQSITGFGLMKSVKIRFRVSFDWNLSSKALQASYHSV